MRPGMRSLKQPNWQTRKKGDRLFGLAHFFLFSVFLLHVSKSSTFSNRAAKRLKTKKEQIPNLCVFITAGPITKLFAGWDP
jgi:hypothetical protein